MIEPIQLPFNNIILFPKGSNGEELFEGSQLGGKYASNNHGIAIILIGEQRFSCDSVRLVRIAKLSDNFFGIILDDIGLLPLQIPISVCTYGELRQWCQEQISQQKKQEEFILSAIRWINYLHKKTRDHETRIESFEMSAR